MRNQQTAILAIGNKNLLAMEKYEIAIDEWEGAMVPWSTLQRTDFN